MVRVLQRPVVQLGAPAREEEEEEEDEDEQRRNGNLTPLIRETFPASPRPRNEKKEWLPDTHDSPNLCSEPPAQRTSAKSNFTL